MLKPTSAFVYVFQGACVELTAVLGEGDCVVSASELQDTSTITKIRNNGSFLTLRLLEKYFGLTRPAVGVICWWAEQDNAALTEPTLRLGNCSKSAANPTGQVNAVLDSICKRLVMV